MFSTAEKTSKTASSAPKQGAAGSFFRKAEESSFFGTQETPSFFNGGTFIQPKLSVSSPDDPHEKEADAVADHVMRAPDTATPQLKQEDNEVQRKTAADDEKKELHPKLETPAITAIQCKEEEGNTSDTEVIQTALLQRHGRAPPTPVTGFEQQLTHSKGGGSALPGSTRQYMETRFGADFSGVRIHTGAVAESLSSNIQAQAFTHGNDIYFNAGKYAPDTGAGGLLLAHELTHTIQQGASKSVAPDAHPVARKPILQRTASDRPVPSQLNNAVAKAKSEVGKVNADKEGPDGYRTGWDRLIEYFKTTLGADKVLPQGAAMVQGAVAEQDIKKQRRVNGLPPANPRPASGPYQRDAMPSWCGIFVFWSLHKGGVPLKPWILGGHNIDLNAAYPPGYHPKAGDIAYRDRFSHYAIVEKSSGDTVTTVNGNTAGEDNLGGQVQVKDHPLAEWTGFFDPLMMKNGELGAGEQAAESKPKTLRELRQELFHVNRKMQDGPEPEREMTEEVHLQTKQEPLSNWQVNESGRLTHAPPVVQPAAVQAKEELVQQKEEEHKEEEEKRAPVPVQLKTVEPKVQRSWLSDAWSTVSNAVGDLVSQGLEAGKRILLREARDFAMAIPGYRALRVVLGEDPITNEVVERNGHNFIEAAFDIMPGGRLLHQKLEELGALTDAEAWVDQQIANLVSVVHRIVTSIENFWSSLSLDDLGSPQRVFERIGNIIHDTISSIVRFAENAASELLSIVKRFLLNQLVSFVREHTTAYPLLCVILGEDPITYQQVAKNGTNILNALLELGGEEGREQRRQMQDTGTFQRIAAWIDRGITVFSNAYEQIRAGIASIWDFVSIESLMHPIDTFNRIYNIFAPPIQQVWNFVRDTAVVILRFIKEVLLRRLSNWARTVRGYQLLTVIIGKDPFTDEVVPRTMENIIRGFMSLMEGGLEQFNQLKESGAIDRTTQRINAAVDRLNMTPAGIVQLFSNLWHSMSLNDLIHPIDAFRRIVATFGEPIGRLIAFVVEIVKIVVEVILQVMNFPTDLISNIITKAMQAFEMIKRDPVGFLKNLLRAIKEGFTQFFNNILRHLLNGLTGWLMSELRDANVPAPQDFSLRGIISWVLQVLGLSMETIWQKLSEHPRIGPQRVARIRSMINTLEGIWTFIRDVQERGIAAIWDRIQEQLSNLWNTILDAVKNWIMEQIVNRVVARLLSMLDPTGIMAVINSAIALYRAVQSFIRYLREMLTVVNSFVEGVVEIASGNTRRAADFLENSLDRAMPIVIGFLANQVGLSGVGHRIAELIGAARQLVDRAVTWLVNRAVDTGFALFDRLMAAGRSAVAAVLDWLGFRERFATDNGTNHTIYIRDSGQAPTLIIESSPVDVATFFNQQEAAITASSTMTTTDKNTKLGKITHGRNLLQGLQTLMNSAKAANNSNPRIPQMIVEIIGVIKEIEPGGTQEMVPAAEFNPGFLNAKAGSFSARYVYKGGTTAAGVAIPKNHVDGTEPTDANLVDAWRILTGLQLSSRWVRFHILNREVGGIAADSNLIPTPTLINNEYKDALETDLKGYYNSGLPVWLRASVTYRPIYNSLFPNRYSAQAGAMKYQNNQWVEDPTKQKTYSAGIDPPENVGFNINLALTDADVQYFIVNMSTVTRDMIDILRARRPSSGYAYYRQMERALASEVFGRDVLSFDPEVISALSPTQAQSNRISAYRRGLSSVNWIF